MVTKTGNEEREKVKTEFLLVTEHRLTTADLFQQKIQNLLIVHLRKQII